MYLRDFKRDGIYQSYLKFFDHIVDSHSSIRQAVILKDFPADPSLFKEDVSPYIKKDN